MEHTQYIKTLFIKYLKDDYTAEELDELLAYFYHVKGENELSRMVREELEKDANDYDTMLAVESLLNRLDHSLLTTLNERDQPVKRIGLWYYGAVAATIAMVLGLSVFFYINIRGDQEIRKVSTGIAIVSGKNTATLVLPGGKTISLSDAKSGIVIDASKLTYNDGSVVAQSAVTAQEHVTEMPVEKFAVSTPRGGQYHVVLPDGTEVWLNAASSLKFPSNFASLNERSVELNGEAYFEVTKNKSKPFIVKSAGQEVQVLGTHFNINAYADEASIKTTLLEGSVMVTGKKKKVMLEPNQQAVLTDDIYVQNVDVENEIAWKNGDFVFDSDDLESTMRKISRWYDVEVIYAEKPDKKMHFGGIVSRAKNIAAVLKIMQSTGQVSFNVKGRIITVIQH